MEQHQQQIKMNVDLKQIPWIKCPGGNLLWEKGMLFKKLSPLLSPSGKEELIPGEVIICKKCGLVPRFFWEKAKDIPEELKSHCGEKEPCDGEEGCDEE